MEQDFWGRIRWSSKLSIFSCALGTKVSHSERLILWASKRSRNSNETQVDIVLMDLQMFQTEGFRQRAAIRHKKFGTGQHLPITLTAYAMRGGQRCLDAGIDHYFSNRSARSN
jgi:CheY-like chemotaxis protein